MINSDDVNPSDKLLIRPNMPDGSVSLRQPDNSLQISQFEYLSRRIQNEIWDWSALAESGGSNSKRIQRLIALLMFGGRDLFECARPLILQSNRDGFQFRPFTYNGCKGQIVTCPSAHDACSLLYNSIWKNVYSDGGPVLPGQIETDQLADEIVAFVKRDREIFLTRLTDIEAMIDVDELRSLASQMAIEREVILGNIKQNSSKGTSPDLVLPLSYVSPREYSYSNNSNGQAVEMPKFVPTQLQQSILDALDQTPLKVDPLALRVCGGDTKRLYSTNALKELKNAGLISHKHGVGYYKN